MSLTNSPIWFGSGATGGGFYNYEIDNSLRFNDDDSAVLTRTLSTGNSKTWTYSFWVKRANLNSYGGLLAVGTGDGSEDFFGFTSTHKLYFRYSSGSDFTSSQVFRDVSSWYHIVLVADTTQSQSSSSASDSRLRYYVNGTQITAFTSGTMPSQNFDFRINSAAQHYIGEFPRINSHLDAYLTEVNFIDGQALDPTSFGEAKEGTWIPKSYGGSYGTNGFYLDFSNNSTATDLGLDSSGNSNNWSVSGIATTDQMTDSPTNNFATLNRTFATSHSASQGGTLSEGNLRITDTGTSGFFNGGTFAPSSGKWYFEGLAETVGRQLSISFADYSAIQTGYQYVGYLSGGGLHKINGDALDAAGTHATYSAGDIIGVAIDIDAGKIWWAKNNVWIDSGDPAAGTSPPTTFTAGTEVVPYFMCDNASGTKTWIANFGQDSTFAGNTAAGGNSDANGKGDFKYAPPSGFLALCTANLPDPTIGPTASTLATDNFNTVLYTGNGSTQSITGVGFQPDWTWCKMRTDSGRGHALFDSVRGGNERIDSSSTQEGRTNEGNISFQSDGFNVTSSHPTVNDNGDSAVAWNWEAGGSASSNSDGSITSSVSANVDAGFSVVSYTGTGATATVGHGIDTPELIFFKDRDSGTANWIAYNKTITATKYLSLNQVIAAPTYYDTFNNTEPTSSVFTLGSEAATNRSTAKIIAYCFHSVEGYSKVGSYTGNGNADGPFIYTGFRPAWVLTKSHTAGYDWVLDDAVRSPYNEGNATLYPNDTYAEYTGGLYGIDFLSNGFKPRTAYGQYNQSGGGYIYLAFAENPFKYANAR